MSVWSRIGEALSRGTPRAIGAVVEAIRTAFAGDPETRRQVSFSVAMIALSAKMAKADGVVTDSEIVAFREIFHIPPADMRHVARLYNIAKQDIAGFESYARTMAGLCGSGEKDCAMLEDILDGLFHIAKADGVVHEREVTLLHRIAQIFEISEAHFHSILARHAALGERDPFAVLGVSRDDSLEEVRRAYRALVAENHPDRLIARGLPEEFIAVANRRMAAINEAYEAITRRWQPA